jgi:2-polyprenyl-6-methoxyphenol hydroxylase-like FAD-dependent oxidoreductase
LALGISDALRDADLLAEAISDGMEGRRPLDEALAAYERERNAASEGDYQQNLAAARFTPTPPEVLGLRAAVRNNPDASRDMMLANFGRIDPSQFFAPENLQRLIQAAAPPDAARPQ